MDIAQQISDIRNPQEFTRLTTALYEAEYGDDYQAVDDDRADGGNDGYIRSEKKLIARHCFKSRPKRGIDKEILNKLEKDFKKALNLREEGMDIEQWTFLTNYPVSHAVIQKATKLGQEHEIAVVIKTHTHVGDLAIKHKKVIEQFPQINIVEVVPRINELQKKLDAIHKDIKTPKKGARYTKSKKANPSAEPDKDYLKVLEIINSGQSEENVTKLKAISDTSKSKPAKLQATFALLDWYDPLSEKPERMVSMIDSAISFAREEDGLKRELAVLHSERAQFLSQIYTESYINRIRVNSYLQLFGEMPGTDVSIQNLELTNTKLQEIDKERIKSAKISIDLANEVGSYDVAGQVMLRLGNSQMSITGIQLKSGDRDSADRNFKAGKALIDEAIRCFSEAGDDISYNYARHNYANHLRNYPDEQKTALEIEKEVLEWAKKNDDDRLADRAESMINTIETGEIPDYISKLKRED